MKKTVFALLCLEGSVLSFNVAASAALIPSIASEFGVTEFVVGKITWLYMLPYGIAALFYGPLVKAFEVKKIELICLFLFCAANLLAGLSHNLATLFTARFLMGVFGASVIPIALILIGSSTQAQNRGRLVGIFFSATFIASLLGLFLSGVLLWRWIYIIPAIFGLILWVHIYMYFPDLKQDTQNIKINYLAAFKSKAVVSLFVYIFLISLIYHGIQQWLSVYFSVRFGLAQFVISILIMLTSFSGIFGEFLGGWSADYLGRIKTVNLGIVLMILSACLLIFNLPLWILALLMVIWGLGWTFNHAGVSTLLTDLPKEFLNEAASLNSSVRFISGGLGAVLGGNLMRQSFNSGFITFGLGLILLTAASKKLLAIK